MSAERILQVVADYKPAFYMAGPYHVQAVSCLVNWVHGRINIFHSHLLAGPC